MIGSSLLASQAADSAFSISTSAQLVLAAQALFAALLGALVGFERGRLGKDAGMRTHALVAAGASIACGLGELVISNLDAGGDATRTLHAIITGVGFIGAGAIIHSDGNTTGVTTAASVLFVAILGGCVGLGAPLLAGLGCVLSLGILKVLGAWQHRRQNRRQPSLFDIPPSDID